MLKRHLLVLVYLFSSTMAFAFGGGHKDKMFDEDWMQGVDAMGIYFGGNGQADIKFKCDDKNATADKNGVCHCNKGYQNENGVCVINACGALTGCRTACSSWGGSATYTLCHGTGTCVNNTCSYNVEKECTETCGQCYRCDKGIGQCVEDSAQYGLYCTVAGRFDATCQQGKGCAITKTCNSDQFLAPDLPTDRCYDCTEGDQIVTTPEQCRRCGDKRFVVTDNTRTDGLQYCQPKPTGCVMNSTGSQCLCPTGQENKEGVCTTVESTCSPACNSCQKCEGGQCVTDTAKTTCATTQGDAGTCQSGKCVITCTTPVGTQCTQMVPNATGDACVEQQVSGACTIGDAAGTCQSGKCVITCTTPAGTQCTEMVPNEAGDACIEQAKDGNCTADGIPGTCSDGECVAVQGTDCVNGACAGNFWCNQHNKCVTVGNVYTKTIENLGTVAHSDSITANNQSQAFNWCTALNSGTNGVSDKTWQLLNYAQNNPLLCNGTNCSNSSIVAELATNDDNNWTTIAWVRPAVASREAAEIEGAIGAIDTVADFWVANGNTVLKLDTKAIETLTTIPEEDRKYQRAALCILCGDCESGSYHPGSDTCICRSCSNATESDCQKCEGYEWNGTQCVPVVACTPGCNSCQKCSAGTCVIDDTKTTCTMATGGNGVCVAGECKTCSVAVPTACLNQQDCESVNNIWFTKDNESRCIANTQSSCETAGGYWCNRSYDADSNDDLPAASCVKTENECVCVGGYTWNETDSQCQKCSNDHCNLCSWLACTENGQTRTPAGLSACMWSSDNLSSPTAGDDRHCQFKTENCDKDHLEYCITQSSCTSLGDGYVFDATKEPAERCTAAPCSSTNLAACENKEECETAQGYYCQAIYVTGEQEQPSNKCVAAQTNCTCTGNLNGVPYVAAQSEDSDTLMCVTCSADNLDVCTETQCNGFNTDEDSMYSYKDGKCQKCTTDSLGACSEAQCNKLTGYMWDSTACVVRTTCSTEQGEVSCGDFVCDNEQQACVNPCNSVKPANFKPTTCVLSYIPENGVCQAIYPEVYNNAVTYCGSGDHEHICRQGQCICNPTTFTLTTKPDDALYTYNTCLGDEGLRYQITGCATCAKNTATSAGQYSCVADNDNHSACGTGGTCAAGTCLPTCSEEAHKVDLATFNAQGKKWVSQDKYEHCATSAGEFVIVPDCESIITLTDEQSAALQDDDTIEYCDDANGQHIVKITCHDNLYFDPIANKCEHACLEPLSPECNAEAGTWSCIENGTATPTITTGNTPCAEESWCDLEGYCLCPIDTFYATDGICHPCNDPSHTLETELPDCALCGDARTMHGEYCIPTCSEGQFMNDAGNCIDCLDTKAGGLGDKQLVDDYLATQENCNVCNKDGAVRQIVSKNNKNYCVRFACATGEFVSPDGLCHACNDLKPWPAYPSTVLGSTAVGADCTNNCSTAKKTTPRDVIDIDGVPYCAIHSCPDGQFRDINGVCHDCTEKADVQTDADHCATLCSNHRTFDSETGMCSLKVCDATTCNGYCDKDWECHPCDDAYHAYQVSEAADCTGTCLNRTVETKTVNNVTSLYCHITDCPVGYVHDTANHNICKSMGRGDDHVEKTCTTSADCPGAFYCSRQTLSAQGYCTGMTGDTLKAIIPNVGLVYRSPVISRPYNGISWCDALNDTTPNTGKDWYKLGVDELRVPSEYRDENGKQIAGTWRIFNVDDLECYDAGNTYSDAAVDWTTNPAPSPVYCCKKNHPDTCATWNAWDQKSSVLAALSSAFATDFAGGSTRKGYWLNRLNDPSETTKYAGYRLNINPAQYAATYRDIYKITGGYTNSTEFTASNATTGSRITTGNVYALCQFCPVTCPTIDRKKHFRPTGEDCICKECTTASVTNKTECDSCEGNWNSARSRCSGL